MIIMSASGHLGNSHFQTPRLCLQKLLQGDHPAPARLDFFLDPENFNKKKLCFGKLPQSSVHLRSLTAKFCFTLEGRDGWKTQTFFHFWGVHF